MATAVSARVFKNLVNGEWVAAKSGQSHLNHNPANTDEVIGEFPLSSQADVDSAVLAARARSYPVVTMLNQFKVTLPPRYRGGALGSLFERIAGDVLGLLQERR
jgi:hypothetical protein